MGWGDPREEGWSTWVHGNATPWPKIDKTNVAFKVWDLEHKAKPSQAKYHGNEGKTKPRGNDPSNNNNAKALGFVPNNFLTSMHILIAVLLKPLSHGWVSYTHRLSLLLFGRQRVLSKFVTPTGFKSEYKVFVLCIIKLNIYKNMISGGGSSIFNCFFLYLWV